MHSKVRTIHSEGDDCVGGGVGWTDVPLTPEVEWILGGPAGSVEATTVSCIFPTTGYPTRSSITVESKAFLTITSMRSRDVNTELLAVVLTQRALVQI